MHNTNSKHLNESSHIHIFYIMPKNVDYHSSQKSFFILTWSKYG